MTQLIATLRARIPASPGFVPRLDRVVLAIIAIFALLLIADATQARASLDFALDALIGTAPFLAASVLIAAYVRATSIDRQIARVFDGSGPLVIVGAALVGALSPFCSCGVVPLIAALLRAGVPLAPVMAFWLASPVMDPQMFLLTAAVLGVPFAVAKTIAAVAIGLAGGLVTRGLAGSGQTWRGVTVLRGDAGGGCGTSCGDKAMLTGAIVPAFWREETRRALFFGESRATGWFLLKWLTLAFVLESLMVAWLPGEMVGSLVGGGQWWSVPLAVLVGVPSYLNGFAAIPTVSALVDLGMTSGAAMAFMVAGAVTSIPAAMAVFVLVRTRVFALYLALATTGALAIGLTYERLVGALPTLGIL